MIVILVASFIWIFLIGCLFLRRRDCINENKAFFSKKLKRVDVKNLKLNPEQVNPLLSTGAIMAENVFDYFYKLSQINPHIINAIQRVHGNSQNLDSVHDVIGYTNQDILSDGLQSHEINKYKGYVGEEIHKEVLIEQGHEVEMAENPNQQGFDMKVDGEAVNVKVTSSSSYIRDHLEKNPGVPVHTGKDTDIFSSSSEGQNFDHLNVKSVEAMTEDGFDAVSNANTGLDFPVITAGLSMFRNVKKVAKGDKSIALGVEHVAVETASVGLGAKAGGTLGTFFLPGAGTVVGGVVGGFIGRGLGNRFKKRHLREVTEELNEKINKLFNEVHYKSPHFKESSYKRNYLYRGHIKSQKTQNPVMAFLNPSLETTFINFSVERSKKDTEALVSCYDNLEHQILSLEKDKDELTDEKRGLGSFLLQNQNLFWGDKNILLISKSIEITIERMKIEERKII